jgi:hypothetical protein
MHCQNLYVIVHSLRVPVTRLMKLLLCSLEALARPKRHFGFF